MKFIAMIIGSDPNCYSAARAIHEAYGIKSQIITSTPLLPFFRSKIADIHITPYLKDYQIYYKDIFVQKLNEIYKQFQKQDPAIKVLLYVPHEIYLQSVFEIKDQLDFEPFIPFPNQSLSEDLLFKERFYDFMDELDIPYPKTFLVDSTNYQDLRIDSKVVIKADDNNEYKKSFDYVDKVFYAEETQEAHHILKKVFNYYDGKMIIQDYIAGGEGTEYSISGYRASDGQLSMAQGRSILTDLRPKFLGNHIVICDSQIKKIFEISRRIIEGMDYDGFFNLDFKLDSQSGRPYVLEINPRLARSFYYANLAGVNLLELAIEDLIFNRPQTQKQNQSFNWIVAGKKACGQYVEPHLKDQYYQPARLENTGHSILYPADNSWMRRLRMKKYISDQNKIYFGHR